MTAVLVFFGMVGLVCWALVFSFGIVGLGVLYLVAALALRKADVKELEGDDD